MSKIAGLLLKWWYCSTHSFAFFLNVDLMVFSRYRPSFFSQETVAWWWKNPRHLLLFKILICYRNEAAVFFSFRTCRTVFVFRSIMYIPLLYIHASRIVHSTCAWWGYNESVHGSYIAAVYNPSSFLCPSFCLCHSPGLYCIWLDFKLRTNEHARKSKRLRQHKSITAINKKNHTSLYHKNRLSQTLCLTFKTWICVRLVPRTLLI